MSFSASIEELVRTSAWPLVSAAPWWERVPLNCVAQILNGYPWKSAQFNDQDGVPVIRIRDVTSGATDTRYRGKIEDGFWIENGNLLIGMDGDFNSRIWTGGRALLNQRVCRISPKEKFYLKKFMAYVLPGYLQLINDETHSITVKHLSSKTLAEIPLPLPPLVEQRRIVTKIDSLTAKSNRTRDHIDHIPRLVEKYKQAILAAAFRGDLTQEWRSQVGRPRDWEDTTLGQLLVDIRYGTAKKCGYDAGAVGVLRIPNVHLGEISVDDLKSADFTGDELKKLRLEEGDILIIRSNGSLDLVGRSAVVDSAAAGLLFAGYLIRLRLNSDLAYPKFVQLYLRTTETRTLVERLAKSTSGVNNINSTQIQQLPISRPNIDEQHEIVRLIDIAFAWVDRLASETTGARKLVDHLDQAILAMAFRGELVPQDPNDEPARVLLERIRTERAAIAG